MEERRERVIRNTVKEIKELYNTEEVFLSGRGKCLPDRSEIIEIIKELRTVVFSGYFGSKELSEIAEDYRIGSILSRVYSKLKTQIELALCYRREEQSGEEEISDRAETICEHFFGKISKIQRMLLKDVQAGFDGDPAAKSLEEIIFSYPGVFAIYIYRIAHELYVENVPFIPRIMTEYAHSGTGIDINPGAVIGEYFFIDHGTGVVIGETTEIGNNVKLYQGVTLGALSTRNGQLLANVKRHPTIRDNVTIYSGATILGGETVIGEGSIIGGNTFITESVPDGTKVSIKNPELTLKGPNIPKESEVWYWEI